MVIHFKKTTVLETILLLFPLLVSLSLFFYDNYYIERGYLIVLFLALLYSNYYAGLLSNIKVWSVLLLVLFSVFVTAVFYNGLGIALIFSNVYLGSLLFNNIDVRSEIRKYMHVGFVLVLTTFLVSCDTLNLTYGSVTTTFDVSINANVFGLLSLANLYHLSCIIVFVRNSKVVKFTTILLIIISVYWIVVSNCRSALISLGCFIVLVCIKKQAFDYKKYRLITIAILLISFVFVLLYLALQSKYGDIVILGKSLYSGREYVWRSALKAFMNSPIFGNGNQVVLDSVGGKTTYSAHNTLLSFLFTLGILPTLSFMLTNTLHYGDASSLRYERISQFSYISSLLVCFVESFFSESHLFLVFLVFLISTQYKEMEHINGNS